MSMETDLALIKRILKKTRTDITKWEKDTTQYREDKSASSGTLMYNRGFITALKKQEEFFSKVEEELAAAIAVVKEEGHEEGTEEG